MTFTEAVQNTEVPDFSVVLLTAQGESLVLPNFNYVSKEVKDWLFTCPAVKSGCEDEIVVETIFTLPDLAYILGGDLPSKDIVIFNSDCTNLDASLPFSERMTTIASRLGVAN